MRIAGGLGNDDNAGRDLFDPQIPLHQIDELAATLTSSVQRSHLEVFKQHVYHENVTLDIDALMATMVPDPEFRFFGNPPRPGIDGYDAVRAYYEQSREHRTRSLNVLIDRLVMDDTDLVMEATMVATHDFATNVLEVPIAPGEILRSPVVLVVPFREGLMAGERSYY